MLPLRFRIALSFCLLLLGTASCVLFLGKRLLDTQIGKASHNAAERTLRVLENSIQNRQQLLSQGIVYLADRPGTRELFETDSVTINDRLSAVQPTVAADWLAYCDSNGTLLGMSSPLMKIGSNPGNLVGITTALGGRSWKGAFALKGHVFLAESRPVKIGEYVKGILVGAKEIDTKLVRDIGQAGSAEVAIVFQNCIVAATFDHTKLHRDGDALSTKIQGESFVGTSTQIKSLRLEAPLEVQALIPRDSVTQPFEAVWKGILVAFAVAILAAGILGSRISIAVTDPIEKMVLAAKDLEDGTWPEPFGSHRKDELGFLLNSFDRMTQGLRENNARQLMLLDVDPLTEIWNHRSFKEKLESALLRAKKTPVRLSVLVVDLDGFDSFNRSHSTQEADQVLRDVSRILQQCAADCVCSRHGGDEFMVLVQDEDAEGIANQIRTTIGQECPVTACVGIAHLDADNGRSDLLMLAAKLAKDTAKQAGRNRVRTFEGFAAGNLDELRQFLQGGSYAAIRALAEAVDAKDEYTRGHSTRVAEYAKGIAETMGLDPGFVELVYVTGTLHDVGKIGVPDSVLKKPGKLTDEEFEEIKKHPALGEKIVSQLPMLKDALPGVRHHHERWDGKGYPDALAGEEIPLLARILAVADTYDAMTSDRPYRKGMPQEVAVKILQESAGTQFDAELVPHFVAWLYKEDRQQAA